MKYRVLLRFSEPYQVDVEARHMAQVRHIAINQACQETGRTGVEWQYGDCEIEIENIQELD